MSRPNAAIQGPRSGPAGMDGSRPILDCPSGEEGEPQMRPDGSARYWTIPMKDRKGSDMTEWPEDLRVRQFPGEQQ